MTDGSLIIRQILIDGISEEDERHGNEYQDDVTKIAPKKEGESCPLQIVIHLRTN